MNSRKISKGAKRRVLLFGSISLISFIYFSYNLISYTSKISKLRIDEKSLIARLDSLKGNEKNLENEIVKLKDPEYIARYARENYQYSKDGEYIIQLEKKDEIKTEETKKKDFTIPFLASVIFASIILIVKKISHI